MVTVKLAGLSIYDCDRERGMGTLLLAFVLFCFGVSSTLSSHKSDQ